MAITPVVNMQSSSTTALQSQEQRVLNQIKKLQNQTEHTAYVNEIKIKALQQQYNALILQQQQQMQVQQSRAEMKSTTNSNLEPKTSQTPNLQLAESAGKGINIEA